MTVSTARLLLLIVAAFAALASASTTFSEVAMELANTSNDYEPTCANWAAMSKTVETITKKDPVVLRVKNNYQITSSYHRIGTMFSKLVGMWKTNGVTHTNWPGLAVWASNTVGFGIRGSMMSLDVKTIMEKINQYYKRDIFGKYSKLVVGTITAYVERVVMKKYIQEGAVNLGKGNMMVFEHIGFHFTRYGQAFCGVKDVSKAIPVFREFAKGFDASEKDFLAGFVAAWQAHYETSVDPMSSDAFAAAVKPDNKLTFKQRAEKMLLSNLKTGYFEQQKLQDAIKKSFPPDMKIPYLPGKSITIPFAAIFTKTMMMLQWADEALLVGRDLPKRPSDGKLFGTQLAALTDAGAIATYKLVSGRTSDLKGSAADDWTSFKQRMRFIGPLFRSRQDRAAMVCHPFSKAQMSKIWSSTSTTKDLPQDKDVCLDTCCKLNGTPQ